MTLLTCLFAAVVFIVIAYFLIRRGQAPLPREVAKIITMPVSTITKEYADLMDRVMNAATKTELAVLEQEVIEFNSNFSTHMYVKDMVEDLSQELRIRSQILSLGLQTMIK